MFTENINEFFDEKTGFAVRAELVISPSVTESVSVIFDIVDTDVFGGQIQSTEYSIMYKSGALQSLVSGSQLEVDGRSFRIREIKRLSDGAIKKATMTKV